MRNVLALLGAGLLAGCCLMHFHVPITEQTQANARTFGSLGQRLLPEDTPPERIAAFRQCLSEAYMEHYGEGEAGTAREREDGYDRHGGGSDIRPFGVLRHSCAGPETVRSRSAFVCGGGQGMVPDRL